MSTKEQTLSWLLRDIAEAEDDVRNGRERPLAEAKELLEHKWAQRRSLPAVQASSSS